MGEREAEGDTMRPYATQQSLIVLPIVIAVAILIAFVWRDGFAWGDVVGALVIGLGVFVVLALLRRFASR
jgi:hypothetical protein